MAQYKVTGVDKTSGTEIQCVIQASTEALARTKAHVQNIEVTQVVCMSHATPRSRSRPKESAGRRQAKGILVLLAVAILIVVVTLAITTGVATRALSGGVLLATDPNAAVNRAKEDPLFKDWPDLPRPVLNGTATSKASVDAWLTQYKYLQTVLGRAYQAQVEYQDSWPSEAGDRATSVLFINSAGVSIAIVEPPAQRTSKEWSRVPRTTKFQISGVIKSVTCDPSPRGTHLRLP